MKLLIPILPVIFLLTACSHSYYVVRHAEKVVSADSSGSMAVTNPSLSEAGLQRARTLKDTLRYKKIRYIFSTNTIRTVSTAAPLANYLMLSVQVYEPVPDQAFIQHLKGLKKNVLIVGHSNTVDDIVNGLTGKKSIPGDLKDNEYDNLFIVTFKNFLVKKISFKRLKYGLPTE